MEGGSRFEITRRGGERFNRRRAAVEDWEISHDKVIYKEQIGNGSFGTVYKAYYFGKSYFFWIWFLEKIEILGYCNFLI